MSGARRLLADGRPLTLGERIGRGGEGEVFAIAGRPELAVKLYTARTLGDRREKIAAMVRAGLAATSPLVAFPAAAVTEESGRFAGFTMRRIVDCKPLFELYAPGARKLAFPKASYRFLVAAAANIARAVAAVHDAGCVIGDINQSGILVSDNALAALIDADSFQFVAGRRRFACHVGVPHYTPPELHGRKLDGVVRTVDHDCFGLAVVLFQLLFMGRHPYAGAYRKGEMPIERAIVEHRFAYSTMRAVGLKPPPAVPTLADFSPALGDAFEAAFAPGRVARRPDAKAWVRLLGELEANLRTCAANALHIHDAAAPDCPWCRMEGKQGISLFVPATGGATGGRPTKPSLADVAAAWRAIEAVAPPTLDMIGVPAIASPPAPGRWAQTARRLRLARRGTGLIGLAGTAVLAMLDPGDWPLWLGVAVLAVLLLARDDGRTRAIRSELDHLDRRWAAAMGEWQRCCTEEPFRQVRIELEAVRSAYAKLPQLEAERLARYRRGRRDEHLAAFLAAYPIAADVAPGADRGVVGLLLAKRIATAADVDAAALAGVPALNARVAQQLLAWRSALERRFVYAVEPTALDRQRRDAIRADIGREAAKLRRTLLGGVARLEETRREIEHRRAALEPQLLALRRRRAAAQADLAAVLGAPQRPNANASPRAAARRRIAVP